MNFSSFPISHRETVSKTFQLGDLKTMFEDILTVVISQSVIIPYGDFEQKMIGISNDEELKVQLERISANQRGCQSLNIQKKQKSLMDIEFYLTS